MLRSDRTGTEAFLTKSVRRSGRSTASLPLALVRTLQDVYDRSLARTTFALVMLAIAGAMALLLGIIGIYGVIAYSVSQRTREIGIRMALGVEQRDVRRMFVRHGFVLSAIGVAVGIGVAAALTRLMTSMLFQRQPARPHDIRGGVGRAARRRDARQLSAGTPCGVAEPGRGAARRVSQPRRAPAEGRG